MAYLCVKNVALRGISACVPSCVEENADLPFYAQGEAQHIIDAIGIERRHVAPADVTVSDLCYQAAEQILNELKWEKDSIDLLALVTQNPDYLNHPTSFVVHERLGLPDSTMCLDYYHGCPGWVTTLSSVTAMMANGGIKRALLLDGDTVSKDQGANNREERPLFGDGATATALEFCEGAPAMYFNIGTQSDAGMALARQHGGYRNPYTVQTLQADLDRRNGTSQTTEGMDAMDVFSFAITKVPKAMKRLCANFGVNLDEIDNLVLHQANKMIVDAIAKRMKFPIEKVPSSLQEYGNTASVSIPLTMVADTKAAHVYRTGHQRSLVCGFGTGLSWGAALFETDKLIIPEISTI